MALVNLYRECMQRGMEVELCSTSFRVNDIRCFERAKIKKMAEVNIGEYDVLLAARSIFDYPIPISDIIGYHGLIVADNTTLYDGNDVYGDIVFTSGRNNYGTLIECGIALPTVSTGCVKVNPNNVGKASTKKIVWIESGHFPYGKIGRQQEADLIRQICLTYLDYEVVVKPRYLRSECTDVKHCNGDHLFYYLDEVKKETPNLTLLENASSLGDVIADAETVIHTYSSAFQEAVLLGKGIINIGDIYSEETIDLRKNRWERIKAYINRAECTCNQADVLAHLPMGMRCSEQYKEYILGNEPTPVEAMIETIWIANEHWKKREMLMCGFYGTKSEVRFEQKEMQVIQERRIRGAKQHLIAQYEYYFDKYDLFDDFPFENVQMDLFEEAVKEWIWDRFELLNNNEFNQAYLMKMAYEMGNFNPKDGWKDLQCKEAFEFFSGKYWVEYGNSTGACECFSKYLHMQEGRQYPRTYIDKEEFVREARNLLSAMCVMNPAKKEERDSDANAVL